MSKPTEHSESYWSATAPETGFPTLENDISVDVAIVGGGIVGLTAAWLLKQSGRSVALLEARRVGKQATGRSTAKVTSQHNIYRELIESFGEKGARVYAEANQAAIERIHDIIDQAGIECEWERRAAYFYAPSQDEVAEIEAEAAAARRLGLPASLESDVPLPFSAVAALRFDEQAQFHPCKYLAGLAAAVDGVGCHVFENTRAERFEAGDPRPRIYTAHATVSARDVIVATHMPFVMQGQIFAKAYAYAHTMLAGRIDPSRAPGGMFISAGAPTHSVRTAGCGDDTYLIAVGGRFRPGHPEDAAESLDELHRFVDDGFGLHASEYRWTNEDFRSMDGLPLVGRVGGRSDHVYVATGFNAWGITNGTAAAAALTDLLSGTPSAVSDLFDASRTKSLASVGELAKENFHVAEHFVRGYAKRRPKSADELPAGEAAILELDGEKTAVYRDAGGACHMISAVCTHMKCIVDWNPVDATWDCPCHGSRFGIDGDVLSGPAVTPLSSRSN